MVIVVKCLQCSRPIRDLGETPGLGRSPGGGHGNHSSTLAWRIPWREEPGRLLSIELHRVGHDWVAEHEHTHGQLIFNKSSLQLKEEMIMFSANDGGTIEKPHAKVKIINLYATLIASLVAQLVKNLPAMQETRVRSLVGKI